MARITCLVDNTAALSSRLRAEHGSAFLVESTDAGAVLFDTGQSGDVIAHNLAELGLSLDGLRAIVLSHGHYDHVGGLDTVLALTGEVEVLAHPAVFDERFGRRPDGSLEPIGFTRARAQLEPPARFRLVAEPVEVAPGVWTSGEIPRAVDAGHADARLLVRRGEELVPDPLVDDQALVLLDEHGATAVLGCCHSGLLNTLAHVTTTFERPVHTVIGGTHLGGADDETLARVMAALAEYGVDSWCVGHCTGPRGVVAFARAFGARVQPCYAGMRWR